MTKVVKLSAYKEVPVRLGEDYGLGHVLLCPRCAQEYLHHGAVTVFDRTEDHVKVQRTQIGGPGRYTLTSKVEDNSDDNPSGRRDGLTVKFYCETCSPSTEEGHTVAECSDLTLCILQHKGGTYLVWRVPVRRS